jgi:glycosyltransferase involved in cell wall biosynthesis
MNNMVKYSIIIPTLWKSNRIHKLLSDLIKCQYVDEIILIDNAGKFFEYYEALDKVKLVQVEENIYVNPAWNLGIKIAKNDLIALCNDDINFDPNIFGVIDENILTYVGIIGMGEGNYKDEINKEKGSYIDIWEPGVNDWGWGCLIMLKKSHWLPIPNEIKIWYGDNIIKDVNSVSKGVLRNFKVETEMSTTSDETEWDEVKKKDYENFISYLKNAKITN